MFKIVGWLVVMSAALYGTVLFFKAHVVVDKNNRSFEDGSPSPPS